MHQDDIFKVLCSDSRRRIIGELSQQPRYVTELAGILNMPQSSISRHLKPLLTAGIVYRKDDASPRDVGEYHIFALDPQARRIGKIIDIAAQICA